MTGRLFSRPIRFGPAGAGGHGRWEHHDTVNEQREAVVNDQTAPTSPGPLLPALLDELERVQLDVEIARRNRRIEHLRELIVAEQAAQQRLRLQIDERIGLLRRDIDRIGSEIQRLEIRLERLTFASRALSDHELDHEEQAERAEEAQFWAEWRQHRDERTGTMVARAPRQNADANLRQLYRALARMIHPDLARDTGDRARREAVMRLANAANEAGDIEQLRRLLTIWSKADAGEMTRDTRTMRARLTEREVEIAELEAELEELAESTLGTLRRRPRADLARFVKREEERLRRDVATLRLRRRRLLSSVEDRRQQLTKASD